MIIDTGYLLYRWSLWIYYDNIDITMGRLWVLLLVLLWIDYDSRYNCRILWIIVETIDNRYIFYDYVWINSSRCKGPQKKP